jgi:RNA polymerase sigma-70 factor (ECF subfamily)
MFLTSQNNEIEETLNFNELSTSLENLLKKLPKRSQEVFRMNRLDGYSKKEIAKLMQISEKAIEYHITKSLKILRLQLKNLFF